MLFYVDEVFVASESSFEVSCCGAANLELSLFLIASLITLSYHKVLSSFIKSVGTLILYSAKYFDMQNKDLTSLLLSLQIQK